MQNRIAEARKARGLTLRQLGKLIGLGNNTISQYETGKREPKLETWQKLASALNVSVPYLQGISNIAMTPSKFNDYANYVNSAVYDNFDKVTGKNFSEPSKLALNALASFLDYLEQENETSLIADTANFIERFAVTFENYYQLDDNGLRPTRLEAYNEVEASLAEYIKVYNQRLQENDKRENSRDAH